MDNLADAAKAYLAERTTQDLPIERQIMLAFGAGAIFGGRSVEAAVAAKHLIMESKK